MKYMKILSVALMQMLSLAMAAQIISVDEITFAPNELKNIQVKLIEGSNYVASGFYVILPDGFTFTGVVTNKTEGHVVKTYLQNDNTMKVAIYSNINLCFEESMDLLSLQVKAGNKTGTFQGTIKGIEYASGALNLINKNESHFTIIVDNSSLTHLVDRINFYLDDDNMTAEVTSMPSNAKYSGTVVIPSSISFNNNDYSVKSIGESAFYNCNDLTFISIPESVTSIANNAFNGCSNLTTVKVCFESPISISSNTFSNRANAILCVPYGIKAPYKAIDYWKEFKKIIENGDVNIDEDVDVVDVVDIARFVVGTPANTFAENLADINNDFAVNLGDAVVVVNNIVGEQNFVKAWRAPSIFTACDMLSLTEHNGDLSLNLENRRYYTAFQFDLYIPENIEVRELALNDERKHSHQLLYNKVEDGHYRIAAFSTSNQTFEGNNGDLLDIVFNGESVSKVSIRDIRFFDTEGYGYMFEDIEFENTTSLIPTFSKGDVDIYDLLGRKRKMLQRGINIVDGKKAVVK